jgi:methionine-rich copper-binding protein CopC
MGLPTFAATGYPLRSFHSFCVSSPLAAAAALLALAAPAPAHAHAVVIDSIPVVGATVPAGDVDVRLHYNSRIDHARSRLTLIGPDGKAVPLAIAADSAPDRVDATAPGIAPGQYRLRWQVLAIDGHLTRGDIPFSVKAP